MNIRVVCKGGAFLLLVPALVALVSWVVMLLWNAVLPDLFGWRELGFWQAAGLLVLSRIFFGGFHGHGGRHGHRHHRMTPEERARVHLVMQRFKGCSAPEREQEPGQESGR